VTVNKTVSAYTCIEHGGGWGSSCPKCVEPLPAKDCSTCKYGDRALRVPLCVTCLVPGGYQNWVPMGEALGPIEGTKPTLPTDAAARKAVPIYSGCIRYFPDALAAVAELSRIGNEQHNPGKPLHWDRSKSGDELDACTRHLFEAGTFDTDGMRHSTKLAWRALANLQKEIEKDRG